MVCQFHEVEDSYLAYKDLECLSPDDLHFSVEKEKKMSPFDQKDDVSLKQTLLWTLFAILVVVAGSLYWFSRNDGTIYPTVYPDNGVMKRVGVVEDGKVVRSYQSKWVKVMPNKTVILDDGTVVTGSIIVKEMEETPDFILEKMVEKSETEIIYPGGE